MKRIITMTIGIALVVLGFTAKAQWTSVVTDPSGDGLFPTLPDGAELHYRFDQTTDSIWFKVDVHGSVLTDSFGLNILFDTDQNPATGEPWWGNNPIAVDRAITIWVTDSSGTYVGTVGVTDSAGIAVANMTNLYSNNITFWVDQADNAFVLGLPRTHLFSGSISTSVVAAVGTHQIMNDEIPSAGQGTITELISSVEPVVATRETTLKLMPNPSTGPVTLRMRDMGTGDAMLTVRNLVGQVMYTNVMPVFNGSLNETMDLSMLREGIYMVQVIQGNNAWMRKIVLR